MKIVWGRSIGWNMSFNGIGKFKPPGWKPMEIKQRIHNGADCYPWTEVFAWLPRQTVSGKWVWLRKIYKRRFWVVWGTGFHMEPHVEYGTVFDMLTHE
jgi:hypothetical protein